MLRALLAGAAVMSVAAAVFAVDGSAKQAPTCEGQARVQPAAVFGEQKVKLERGDKTLVLAFRQSRKAKSERISLTATPSLTEAAMSEVNAEIEEDLVSAEHNAISPTEGLTVGRERTQAGNLRVCVALDPSKVNGLEPGRYLGAVQISGAAVEATSVPVEVTFRDGRVTAWILAVIGVVVGLILKALGELAAGKRRNASISALIAYVSHWTFIATLVAMPLLAWLAVKVLYDANDIWGADTKDSLKLVGTCLGYQLGGVAVFDIVRGAIGGRTASS